jgi:hypothetical protein
VVNATIQQLPYGCCSAFLQRADAILALFREMANLDQLQMTETRHKQNEIVDGLRKVDFKGIQQYHRVSSKH